MTRNDTAHTAVRLINHFMKVHGDTMTRQVRRQLDRLDWKAVSRKRDRRGQRCPYERAPYEVRS